MTRDAGVPGARPSRRRGFLRGCALAATATLGARVAGAATGAAKRAATSAATGAAKDAAPGAAKGAATAAPAGTDCSRWPEWEAFKQTYVSADGRVIDLGSARTHTVSEGQAYALFFALVADDRATFDRLLSWTENNLAGGDLTARLPGWIWGRRDDGSWGLVDEHSAADADLWLAYTLVEAGRIWDERRLQALGLLAARHIADTETARLPGLGQTVLPGPVGFKLASAPPVWRLNPSYVPLQVMRRLAAALPGDARWAEMVTSSVALIVRSAQHGFSPDWVEYDAQAGFRPDRQSAGESAYNAIRVYLWAGMLAEVDPARASLLRTFGPLADFVAAHGFPPEKVSAAGVPGPNAGPPGFSAAVAPFLSALGRPAAADAQMARAAVLARDPSPSYYGHVLWLFALGWHDGRYRFAPDGALQPRRADACGGAAR